MNEGYDVGQVCLNGHSANSSSASMPQFNQDHCERCGERTITACLHCQTSIRGRYHFRNVLGALKYDPPAYCYKCGKPASTRTILTPAFRVSYLPNGARVLKLAL
ncbi:MAG: DUF2321 domain-containing protein [Verrucomicrobiia bacterium]